MMAVYAMYEIWIFNFCSEYHGLNKNFGINFFVILDRVITWLRFFLEGIERLHRYVYSSEELPTRRLQKELQLHVHFLGDPCDANEGCCKGRRR